MPSIMLIFLSKTSDLQRTASRACLEMSRASEKDTTLRLLTFISGEWILIHGLYMVKTQYIATVCSLQVLEVYGGWYCIRISVVICVNHIAIRNKWKHSSISVFILLHVRFSPQQFSYISSGVCCSVVKPFSILLASMNFLCLCPQFPFSIPCFFLPFISPPCFSSAQWSFVWHLHSWCCQSNPVVIHMEADYDWHLV